MLTLAWSETALEDLEAVVGYIGAHNFSAALKLRNEIEAPAERLIEHPFMYRSGRVLGTREAVVHPNYVLVYHVGSETVEILNIIHTRRRYPGPDES